MGKVVPILVVLVIVVGAYMYFSGGAPEEPAEAPAAEAPAAEAPAAEAPAADAGSSN